MFCGNSVESDSIFLLQKRILRAMFNLKPQDSCKPHFLKHNILTLPSIYILESLVFLKSNPTIFSKNSSIYSFRNFDYQYPIHRLKLYEEGAYYSSMKLFNALPIRLKCENMPLQLFKSSLKRHLFAKAFYSVAEFLNDG